jgi:hypothetical protein
MYSSLSMIPRPGPSGSDIRPAETVGSGETRCRRSGESYRSGERNSKNEVAAAKGQSFQPKARARGGRPTFRYRDGKLYEFLTAESMKDPGKSGISVDVGSGTNTVDFAIMPDGKVQVTR